MHDDFEAKSFASVGSLFDFVLDNIFGQSNARKFTSSSYDPIDVIEEAHSIKEMASFKQQMQTCDLLFRKVITTRKWFRTDVQENMDERIWGSGLNLFRIYLDTNDCKSQKAQAKKFTRLFLRANIKRSKYEQQFDLDLSTGKPTGKPGTKPTGKPQVTAGWRPFFASENKISIKSSLFKIKCNFSWNSWEFSSCSYSLCTDSSVWVHPHLLNLYLFKCICLSREPRDVKHTHVIVTTDTDAAIPNRSYSFEWVTPVDFTVFSSKSLIGGHMLGIGRLSCYESNQ